MRLFEEVKQKAADYWIERWHDKGALEFSKCVFLDIQKDLASPHAFCQRVQLIMAMVDIDKEPRLDC